jgi:hypothetical protein
LQSGRPPRAKIVESINSGDHVWRVDDLYIMLYAAFYKFKITSLIDFGIALRTLSKYSHCEFRFSDGMCFSSTTRVGPTEGVVQDGCRFKQIDMNPDRWDFVPLPFLDEARLRNWCAQQVGRGYDYAGIFAYLIPGMKPDAEKYFCSEVLATGICEQGWKFPREPYRIAPGTLNEYLVGHKYKQVR